jgi:two-component system, LytTR family, sensor histidine kinase AlgZ
VSVPAALLLSPRERYAVTAGLVLALIPPMVVLALAGRGFGAQPPVLSIVTSVAVIVLSSASMPLLSDVAQRAVLRGPLVRLLLHLALASAHVVALLITVLAVLFTLVGRDLDLDLLGPTFVQTAQSGFLCYAATAGVIRAIQWYRSISLAEEERRALESAQLEKARDLVEQTLRPALVVEALRRIRDMLPDRQAEAERAVTRLARHGRMLTAILAEGGATAVARLRTLRSVLLLHGTDVDLQVELDTARGVPPSLRAFAAATEESAQRLRLGGVRIAARTLSGGAIAVGVSASGDGAASFVEELVALAGANGWSVSRSGAAAELELRLPDDAPAESIPARSPIPMARHSGSVYTWVVIFAGTGMFVNLYATTLPPRWFTSWSDVAAALIWLVAALPLILVAERIVTLRWWIAVPALFSTAWLTGTAVAVAAISAASAYTAAMSLPVLWIAPGSVLPLVARQNVLIACAIACVSFAFANGRRLLGTQDAVGRMRQALASAELRNLEARIQPHFLFNALVSLLALIRLDPARAAQMCELLRDLFARSVAASGVHEWPLREELALTADYLAVQHIRFGERLVVETTVDPRLHDRLIPRLLLQPLVENAVKHGVARREEPTRLKIEAACGRGALQLTVINDSLAADCPPAAGGGLTFVRSRAAAAGGTVECDASHPGTFRVRCVLP